MNPSVLEYVLGWLLFSLVSLLPLSLALVMLRVAPARTVPVLVVARRWIERHARTVALLMWPGCWRHRCCATESPD